MNQKEQVKEFYKAWNESSFAAKSFLADDLVHISPLKKYTNKADFLKNCFGKFTVKMTIRQMVEEGDTVCVWYDTHTSNGVRPICEWFTFREGLICEIRVFF